MNIVASEFWPALGGMEQHAFNLARSMAAHCDVTVFTSAKHRSVEYDETLYPVRPCLVLDILQDAKTLKDCAPPDIWLVLNAGYAPLASELAEPVAIYCHGNDFLNPWITTERGDPALASRLMAYTPYLWRYAATVQSRVCRRQIGRGLSDAAGIYVNSSFTKELLKRKYKFIAKSIKVHPPGIASHFFLAEPAREGYVPGTELRLLTVARLSSAARKKNVDNLIRAVASIGETLPVHLTIVGDGDLTDDLKALARDVGVQDVVVFLGALSGPEIRSQLENTDLFVLASKASRTDVESFGIVYVEAAAAGVPSLISRSGGAVDAVEDGVSGIIIEDSNHIAIANGIKEFVQSHNRFDPRTVREFANCFKWPRIAERLFHDIRLDSDLNS